MRVSASAASPLTRAAWWLRRMDRRLFSTGSQETENVQERPKERAREMKREEGRDRRRKVRGSDKDAQVFKIVDWRRGLRRGKRIAGKIEEGALCSSHMVSLDWRHNFTWQTVELLCLIPTGIPPRYCS